MKREELFDAITNVGDALVDGAAQAKPDRGKARWLKLGGIAAVFALAIGLGAGALRGAIPLLPEGFGPGGNAAGSGHDGGMAFMAYAGPVFPLTALEGGGGLTAERALTYDFSPWTPVWRPNGQLEEGGYYNTSHDLLVTDSYTLANPTGEDRAVTLLYPFVSSLYRLEKDTPALTADGAPLPAALHAGGYSGGFQGVYGAEDAGLLNLDALHSWEGYRDLLAGGGYQERALGGFPDLSGTPAVVYEFTDSWGPEPDSAAGIPNPTIRAEFDLDYGKTTVLSYGFHGASIDPDAGHMIQSFSIPRDLDPNGGQPFYLIVLGEDIANLTTQGYATGGSDTTQTVKAGVSVRRYQTDLDSALRRAARLMYDGWYWEGERPDFELYFGLMKDELASYGLISDSPVARYDTGWLAESDFQTVNRVFYLEAQITIPAGGAIGVEASFTKAPSYDHYCAHTEGQGVYGYDMVTELGTSLDFTALTARAVNTGSAQIVRQNYGFDWENGVDTVTLDLDTGHYYLEVRAAEVEASP